jgi:hypothetical protein
VGRSRAGEQSLWDDNAECLRGLQIDDLSNKLSRVVLPAKTSN